MGKHFHYQVAITVGLTVLSAAEVLLYGVPAVLAIPATLINYLWVWE